MQSKKAIIGNMAAFLAMRGIKLPSARKKSDTRKRIDDAKANGTYYRNGTIKNPKVAAHVNMMYHKWASKKDWYTGK